MLHRLFLLILLASLALGQGPGCCLPDAAAADVPDAADAASGVATHAGCHQARSTDARHDGRSTNAGMDDVDQAGDEAGCQRCSHCLTSAPLAPAPRPMLIAAPAVMSAPLSIAIGLPPFAPAIRPPIAGSSINAT